MKRLLLLSIIVLLVWFSCRLLIDNHTIDLGQTDTKYTIKTWARDAMPGEDIRVYDKTWKEVLSLLSEDPQYVYALVWDTLILDIWTSASQRIFAIYDISSQNKIFQSTYYPSEDDSLAIQGTAILFSYKIWNIYDGKDTKPSDAPSCTGLDNGYVEKRSFDFVQRKMSSSWTFACAYFE